ncbi:NAD kinase [Zavarzinia sp. CC-PAN008]|uniref:NAD kinase n=1 Tax=Zavarzinia sp. CC-PAN008 TaxID=3243332 RepID=UPI003F746B52
MPAPEQTDSPVPEPQAPEPRRPERLTFVASPSPRAQSALESLAARYKNHPVDQADVIVALGGDGFMLTTLHRYMARKLPIYGMNQGTVGFLMNRYDEIDLPARLAAAEQAQLHPLRMTALTAGGSEHEALAINEVSMLRETRQAAKLRITVNGRTRLQELACDGVLVSTPVGSTAYNLSAHGPILPLNSNTLALTPISAFRPRRWHGAILPDSVTIGLEVLEADKRPVSAVADNTEVRQVVSVQVAQATDVTLTMLFDVGRNLDERILTEQFFH